MIILEVVTSQDFWILHAFFDVPNLLNDINVINMSQIFKDIYNITTLYSSFLVHKMSYQYVYYLVDEIYLECFVIVKTLSCPNDQKRVKFKSSGKGEERC